MSLRNKILLYKTVLKPILLNGSQVLGSVTNSNLQTVQMMQNKALKFIRKTPRYVRNDTIHRNLKVDLVRTSIRKISTNFFENLYTIPYEIFYEISNYEAQGSCRRPCVTLLLPNVIKLKSNCLCLVVHFVQGFKIF